MLFLKNILKGVAIVSGAIIFTFLVTILVTLFIASVNHHSCCDKFGESWKCNYMVTRGIMTNNDVVFLQEMAESHKTISNLENRVSNWTGFRSQNQTYTTTIVQLFLINKEFQQLINKTQSDYDRFSLIEVSPTFSALKMAYMDNLLDYEEFSIYGFKATSEFLKNNSEKGSIILKTGQMASKNRTASDQKLKRELNNVLDNCEAQMSRDFSIFGLGAIILYGGFIGLVFFNRKQDN